MSALDPDRWECMDCHEITNADELLTAPHPFDSLDIIHGCPSCLGTEFRLICDVPTCTGFASCGTPTADGGYRNTCGNHRPSGSPGG